MRVQEAVRLEKEISHLDEATTREQNEETRVEHGDRMRLEQLEDCILEAQSGIAQLDLKYTERQKQTIETERKIINAEVEQAYLEQELERLQ
jgi:hypothetical protein